MSEQDVRIEKIAIIGRLSTEMVEDFPTVAQWVDQRLRWMVMEREEAQLINGNRTSPNLRGLLNLSGIQTEAMGANNGVIAVQRAITKIRVNGHTEASAVVVHPNDWQEMKLTMDANLQPYGGGPFYAPYGAEGYINVETIWVSGQS